MGSAPARGQEADHLIITGTRLERSLAASRSDVIDVSMRAPISAVDLLIGLPSLAVQQAGPGSVASLLLRGAKPNFTLVLLDGTRIGDPTNNRGGAFDASTFAMGEIERVEILRGPTSAIYGSDAVGGVVHVITATPGTHEGLRLRGTYGAFGTQAITASFDQAFTGGGYRIGGGARREGASVPGGGLDAGHLDAALVERPTQALTFDVRFRFERAFTTSFPDSSGGPLFARRTGLDHRSQDQVSLAAKATYDINSAWRANVSVHSFERRGRITSPGIAPSPFTPTGYPASEDDARFDRHSVNVGARYDQGGALTLAFGSETIFESGDDRGTLRFGPVTLPSSFARARRTDAGYGEAALNFGDLAMVSAGLRADAVEGEATQVSPHVGVSVFPWPGGTIEANYGEGFKAPSFYALGNPLVGDPRLRSETARDVGLGLVQDFGRAASWPQVKLAWYKTSYQDLIDFSPAPTRAWSTWPVPKWRAAKSAHAGRRTKTLRSILAGP